jgi:tetratricopeptide (TPR) repeat protein
MKKTFTIVTLCVSLFVFSQNNDENLYEGNESYQTKKYTFAEKEYRTSAGLNKKNATASYNLGNSIYEQKQYGEAQQKFIKAAKIAKTKEEKHKAFHNLGNTFLLDKNYAAAEEAYKNALRNNPYDEETRYNYALAKQKNQENPPENKNGDKKKQIDKDQEQQQDKKEKQDKGKNKDKKESDKGEDDKKNNSNQPDKDKSEGDKKEDEDANPRPKGSDKQQIDNLLDAVNNAEKKIQDKLNAKKVKPAPAANGKDW